MIKVAMIRFLNNLLELKNSWSWGTNSYLLFPTILLLINFLFISCGGETEEQNILAQAEECCRTAVPSNAHECYDMVAGIYNEEAYFVRCTASYIKAGITEEDLVEAMISSESGSGESTANFLDFIRFESSAVGDQVYGDCKNSAEPGMYGVAALSSLSTDMAEVSSMEDRDFADVIDYYSDPESEVDEQEKDEMGGKVVEGYNSLCSGGNNSIELCISLRDAVLESSSNIEVFNRTIELLQGD